MKKKFPGKAACLVGGLMALSLISGLDRPSQGEVILSGTNLSNMTEAELTKFRGEQIGIIFQTFHLINYMTAKENIEVVYRLNNKSVEAEALLKSVGLEDRMDHFPHNMSGGECQRLAIARALAGKPSIIIADEPSGNLDHETGKQVMDLLFSLVEERGVTLILVTHDLELAKRTQHYRKIEGGHLNEY